MRVLYFPDMPNRPEQEPRREQAPLPYYQAARFPDEHHAGRAYSLAQQAIYTDPENDLSVYRIQLNTIWHVVVLGQQPPERLEQKLQEILASGEPTSLPPELLKLLTERRAQATQIGPWVEGHYRSGKRIR